MQTTQCNCVVCESKYKNAIRVLQQALRVPVDGRYQIETAKALYEKIKRDVKKGQGYLASEDDPDRLFQNGFHEYIFCVDKVIWGLCGLEKRWLRDDGDRVWNSDAADHDNMDEMCKKRLAELSGEAVTDFWKKPPEEPGFQDIDRIRDLIDGRQRIVSPDFLQSRMKALEDDAKMKAREILDRLLSLMELAAHRERILLKEDTYESNLNHTEASHNLVSFFRSLIANAPDMVIDGFNIWAIFQGYNLEDFSLQDLFSVTGKIGEYYANDAPNIKGLLNIPELPTDEVDKAQSALDAVRYSEWKYLMIDKEKFRRWFIVEIQEKLDEMTDITYSYGDSIWETRLYNQLIQEYLKNVKLINEHYEFSNRVLKEKLK